MKFKDLSDTDILELQYSLLEELKQTKHQTPITIENNNLVTSSFGNEKRSELISARVAPTVKKTIEESNYSFGDALYNFAEKLLNVGTSDSVYDFINQRFADDGGNLENDSEYLARLLWFDNNCCELKQLSKLSKYRYQTIRKWSSRFNWKNIRKKAIELGYRPQNKISVEYNAKPIKRESPQYLQFRQTVLKRDKVCQCCGKTHELEVHHLFSFNKYNHLGADPKNGIVLCKECHKRYHSQYGTKKHNNPITFSQFLRDYGMTSQTQLSIPYNREELMEHREVALDIVKAYNKEFDENCPVSFLYRELDVQNYSDDEQKQIVNHLIQMGLCYYPQEGIIRIA